MYKRRYQRKIQLYTERYIHGIPLWKYCSSKLSRCEMKYQMIMARTLSRDRSYKGNSEGDIVPGDITFYRLQSTPDNKLVHTLQKVKSLPVATRSFGAYRCLRNPRDGKILSSRTDRRKYPHHGAVAFGHYGKNLFEVFKYIGVPVKKIGYNQPAGVRYPTENPWGNLKNRKIKNKNTDGHLEIDRYECRFIFKRYSLSKG